MGFELPNGKTARNIQEQVKFLSEKLKELIAFVNQAGLKSIQIVEELPEVGDPTVLYLLAKEDPDTGDYYDEYLWIDGAWEKIGSTQIDLSDYVTLSTDQTITGAKTFTDKTQVISGNNGIQLNIDEYGNREIKQTTNGGTTWTTSFSIASYVLQSYSIRPLANNAYDLGTSSYTYKDLYLSGQLNISSWNLYQQSNGYWALTQTANNIKYGVQGGYYLFAPFRTNEVDLGASSNNWKNCYISGSTFYTSNNKTFRVGVNTSGTAIFTYTGTDVAFLSNSTNWTFNCNILPNGNNTFSLGSSSSAWKDAYIAGNISDGTNSFTVASIAAKQALYKHNITINLDNGDFYSGCFISSTSTQITTGAGLNTEKAKLINALFADLTTGGSLIMINDMEELAGEYYLEFYIVGGSGSPITDKITSATDTVTIL